MLPGTGYFRALPCPFYEMGFCERPYCHFKHVPTAPEAVTNTSTTTSNVTISATTAVTSTPSTSVSVTAQKDVLIAPAVVKQEIIDEDPPEKAAPTIAPTTEKEAPTIAPTIAPTTTTDPVLIAPDTKALEQLVQDAVRKLLLGQGTAGLLGSVDTSAILTQIKKEKTAEEDEDSDCVIEEVVPAPLTVPATAVTQVKVENEETNPSISTKPKLYLPPVDCPVYNPTPINELPASQPSSLLPGLQLASSLNTKKSVAQPKIRTSKPKFSYKPPEEAVLGDIGDLSNSEDENFETPDVLANILKDGNKSGVLVGGVVSEFEEQVIKEKLKLSKKENDKLSNAEPQCAQITSSNPTQTEIEEEKEPEKSPEPPPPETEDEKADRKLREKEEEVRKLEEKRLMLEKFYNAKLKEKKLKELKDIEEKLEAKKSKHHKGDSVKKRNRDRSRSSHRGKKKRSKKSHHSETDDSSDETSTDSDSESSSEISQKKKKHSRHRSSHKSSKHKRQKDSRKESKSSSRSKSKRDRRKSSTDDDISQSSSDEERRDKKKHKKTDKKDVKEKDNLDDKSNRKKRRDGDQSDNDESESSNEKICNKKKHKKSDKKDVKEKHLIDKKSDRNDREQIGSNGHTTVNKDGNDIAHLKSSSATDKCENISETVKVKEEPPGSPQVDHSIVDSEDQDDVLTQPFHSDHSIVESKDTDNVQTQPFQQLKIKSLASLIEGEPINVDKVATELINNDLEQEDDIAAHSEDEFVPETGMSFGSALGDLDDMAKSKKKEDKSDGKHSKSSLKSGKDDSDHKSRKSSHHKSSRSSESKETKSSSHKHNKSSSHRSSSSKTSEKSSEHQSSHRKSSDHRSSDRKSSEHRSSSDRKSSEHKSSSDRKSSEHKSSSDKKSSEHKSSSERKSSHHKSSDRKSSDHKSSSDRKSSHHNSSKEKYDKSKQKYKTSKTDKETEDENVSDDDLDVPDLSEELALLPDDMDDFEKVKGGLEDIFAGVEDEDELHRVFESYKTDESAIIIDPNQRKRKSSDGDPASQASTTTGGKKRVAYTGADISEKRPLHMKKPSNKTPAQAMHERYKKIQAMKQQQMLEKKLTEITEDAAGTSSSSGVSSSSFYSAPSSAMKKRVAHTPNAELKQQLANRPESSSHRTGTTAAVTCPKGTSRTAHTPSLASIPRPLVVPDPHSKIPTNVRQRYLNSIIDECLKISGNDELVAYARAEKEEADCSRKASSRMIYLNLAVNCIKRLRTEATESAKAASDAGRKAPAGSLGRQLARQGETSHLAVLAGKGGTISSWSIEKPKDLKLEDIDEAMLYKVMVKYALTEEQLVDNGFPRTDPNREGRILMKYDDRYKPDPDKLKIVAGSEDKRLCCRCGAIYRVDKQGLQTEKESCLYHWGRCFRARGSREKYNSTGTYSVWTCCQAKSDEDGCTVGEVHVTDTMDWNNMRGFISTLDKGEGEPGRVFALDCEMCNTTVGNELTRVTVIDYTGQTCYETLVLPENPIVDYNTRFSGITAEDMEGVTTTLLQVQAYLLHKFSSRDILLGHSLESDLRALKLVHGTVVDTSVVFPHNKGPPFKRALRTLVQEHLRRIIQDSVDGHDSKEDALACLDLMKMKAVDDIKKLQNMARHSTTRRDNYLTDPENVTLN